MWASVGADAVIPRLQEDSLRGYDSGKENRQAFAKKPLHFLKLGVAPMRGGKDVGMTPKKWGKKAPQKKTDSSYRPGSTTPDTTAMNTAVYTSSSSDSSSGSCGSSSSSSYDSGSSSSSSCDSGGGF